MYRTRTTATLLMGLAVTAVSGCVGVNGPTDAAPRVRPSEAAGAPRPANADVPPRIVQAPALEALEMMPPTPPPSDRPARQPVPAAAAERDRPAAAPTPAPDRPAPSAGAERPAARTAPPPPAPPRVPGAEELRDLGDVCALGRRYGGWQPGSPESRICADTYGG
ncbi:hypothetical protein [Streptomyces sp. NPDC060194]|uniref:hypothetical protein n=1 Tax=Streptomyces sp. NPDC060194 TaxID=3347069 RepID=UPI00364B9136